MKYGGIAVPLALTATQTVKRVPRSAEVIEPTCFLPRDAITPSGRWTVVKPLSSALKKFVGEIPLFLMSSTRSKNSLTLWRLKLVARLREVACGLRMESCGLRFKNPASQSFPAIEFVIQFGGHLSFSFTAKSYANLLASFVVRP